MNFHIYDIIFVLFLTIMAIFGYIKGFITRLYDIVGTFVVIFLSYFFMRPVSSLWIIYPYESTDALTTMIGHMMNQIMIFVILLVVFTIIKKILGLAIKPLLKGLSDSFTITTLTDKLLGILFSVIEGIIISYLCLVFVVIPFYDHGTENIQKTFLTKYVIQIVPDVANQLSETISGLETFHETSSQDTDVLVKLMLTARDMNLIDDEQFMNVFQTYVETQLEHHDVALSSHQLQKLEDILRDSGYVETQLDHIISKINVSDK